jgi:NAD kinase
VVVVMNGGDLFLVFLISMFRTIQHFPYLNIHTREMRLLVSIYNSLFTLILSHIKA